MDRLVRVIATFGGTGHFPIAPATFASLVFGVIWFLVPVSSPLAWAIVTAGVIAIGVPVATRAERFYGHDGSPIVIDEVAGMLITLCMAPRILWVYGLGFLLFRIFDIVKPFPAGRAQSLPGGWGVMTDDILAGLYSFLVLRGVLLLAF